jgi:two-component system sensor histidine kinase KdpD
MVFLLGITVVASLFGQMEAVTASVVSVLVFDYAFVPPRWTFAVSDTQYVITFLVMLAVGLLISRLTVRLKEQATGAADRERRTAALYSLSRELARSRGKVEIAAVAAREIEGVFDCEVSVLVLEAGAVTVIRPSASRFESKPTELVVAQWALDHDEAAGKGTDTLSASECLYLPLRGSRGAVGVLGFHPGLRSWPLPTVQRNLLETFANGLGVALERAQLARESHEARIQAESEKVRNALLSSISHDLRTPLTSIAGAASALVAQGGGELADTIYHESMRLNLQVQNLLDITRLQSGEVKLDIEWNSLEEIIGSALARTRAVLQGRSIQVEMPASLPLLPVDAALIEKLFINLFENVANHTPSETGIEVFGMVQTDIVRIIVADRGPGIPKGQENAIFERFATGGPKGAGLGLGLAICRSIMRLHSGRIWVQNRRGGGAEFQLEFPRPKSQPEVPVG